MLKTHVSKRYFNNDSNQDDKEAENDKYDFQNRTTEHTNKDQCSSSSRAKRKQLSNEIFEKDNKKEYLNRIKTTFLFKIPNNKLRNFYKYQFYNFSLQEIKTEWDTLMIIPKYNAIINIEVKLGPKDCGDKLELLTNASEQTQKHFFFHK